MAMSAEERAERRRERRAEQLRDTYEPVYEDFSEVQLKDEILRLLTQKQDLEEEKKAHADAHNALIKEKKEAIEFCRERIDYLRHEEAVAAQLENQG
jgi:hypothetical protein